MSSSKTKKTIIFFSVLVVLGLIEIYAEKALFARKQTTVLLSIFPSWVTLAVLLITTVLYAIFWLRPRQQFEPKNEASILNQEAPVKLVLLSLCIYLLSSYIVGIIFDTIDKSSYPPLSQTRLVNMLAFIPAVLFFWYYHKRNQK